MTTIATVGAMIDSGSTGGGCLVDGQDCAGYWARYVATAADGHIVQLCTEHLYRADGTEARATATADGQPADGVAVAALLAVEAEQYRRMA